MKYLYNGHMGSMYTSDDLLARESLYCEQCGDSDYLIGSFETIADFWNLIKDECDIDGNGGWALQYVYPIIVSEFDLTDEVKYENYYDKSYGVCCHSDDEILARINELIKEN